MSAGIIAVAQQKGGAGKTTLAVQLAVTLAVNGQRVGLIDIDPQKSSSAWHAVRDKKIGAENTIVLASIAGWKLDTALNRQTRNVDVVNHRFPAPCRDRGQSRDSRRRSGAGAVTAEPDGFMGD